MTETVDLTPILEQLCNDLEQLIYSVTSLYKHTQAHSKFKPYTLQS